MVSGNAQTGGGIGEDVGTIHAYPPRSAVYAALRAAVGVGVTAALWGLLGMGTPVTLAAVLLVSVFLLYGVRAVVRLRRPVGLDLAGLTAGGPPGRRLRFDGLTGVRLAYYSTRWDGENGWMELKLRDGDGMMIVESEIEGFNSIAAAAFAAARRRGVRLSNASERNFAMLLARMPAPVADIGDFGPAGAAR